METLILETVVRAFAAVIIGGAIGSERARHGRAAGMRTHILVCLGSCMTALTSVYVYEMGMSGDTTRLPAQVISGIGFLGAGMIILKNNTMITGLTTAAGVWTTATIGIALGYGYYIGALVVAALFFITIILLARFERKRQNAEVIYIEIDSLYRVNEVITEIENAFPGKISYQVISAKSNNHENVGINIIADKRINVEVSKLLQIENVVFAIEE